MPALWRPLGIVWRFLRRQVPPANFITLHYLYFIATCLLSSVIFWGASTPPRSVRYIDSLFLTVSAMTGAGLNTINLSTLNTFQQFLLFLLIMLGSAIFVSAFVVQIRRAAFEKKFKDVIATRNRRDRSRGRSRTWSFGSRQRATASTLTVADETGGIGDAENGCAVFDEEDTLEGKDNSNASSKAADSTTHSSIPLDNLDANRSLAEGEKHPPSTPPIIESSMEVASSPVRSFVPTAITFGPDVNRPLHASPSPIATRRRSTSIFAMHGVGARPTSSLRADSERPFSQPDFRSSYVEAPITPISGRNEDHRLPEFLRRGGWISRNSQFHGLTAKEREQLGGYEYRAVSLLAWVVPIYFVLWQLLGCLSCAAWVAYHRAQAATENGLDPWWTGAFNAVSAFNNSGMSLLDANMTAFQDAYYLLLTMGLLILAGNTCYPVFLRLIVWTMYQLTVRFQHRWPPLREYASTLKFLLDHPRRCYTNLFPRRHTWWLLMSVVMLNGIDWAAFEILNIGNGLLDNSLSAGERVIDGLFQALAVRSGGFYVVTIPNLRISLLVLYVVMMYISVYPVVITMRNSNVYEERSLGIYAEDDQGYAPPTQSLPSATTPVPGLPTSTRHTRGISTHSSAHPKTRTNPLTTLFQALTHAAPNATSSPSETNTQFMRTQLRAQLAHDLWWIALALFLIMIIENSQFVLDPATFSVFNFLFEIVSAYGCVGISVGLPDQAYSFCGAWHSLSKLILCAVMLRGRHRGLPVAIDMAVLLPGEDAEHAEERDAWVRDRSRGRGREV